VTRSIRSETPFLEKPWSSIPNQLDVEGLTWKNYINYIKELEETIKRMRDKN
jgi:hypothetical protein